MTRLAGWCIYELLSFLEKSIQPHKYEVVQDYVSYEICKIKISVEVHLLVYCGQSAERDFKGCLT